MNLHATAKPGCCPACGAALPADAPMGLCVPCLFGSCVGGEPSRFGDFELLGPAREGGMGAVYRARQISLNRIVALKMIRGSYLATPAQVQRFRAEAEAAAALDHPHIVPIHEVGEYEGRLYFAMKWMDGGSLADVLLAWGKGRKGERENDVANLAPSPAPSPLSGNFQFSIFNSQFSIAALMVSISRAVHHAHQRGLIHRDLKPSNILLDSQGQPHVTDFGLAKKIEGAKPACDAESPSPGGEGRGEGGRSSNSQLSTLNLQLTLSGDALGTPAYMAPEQAAGKARDVTTAADVYSLGAILYELLAGRPPFTGDTPLEILRKVVEEDPVPPSKCEVRSVRERGRSFALRPSPLSLDLETICLKCLEKDPTRRYASADALADDLARWLRHEPILAKPSGPLGQLAKWVRRRPVIAGLTALLVATFASGFTLVLWKQRQTERAHQQAVANVERALDAITRYLIVAEDHPQWRGIKDLGVRNYEMRKALLQTTVPLLNDLAAPIGKNAGLAYRRAVAYRRVAEWDYLLGLADDGITNAQHARRIFKALADAQPHSSVPRRELADTGSLLARLFWLPGLGPETEAVHRQVIVLNERLAADFPKEPLHRLKLAESRADCAIFLCDPILYPNRVSEGTALYEKVLVEFELLRSADPNSHESKRALVRMILNVETHLAGTAATVTARTNRLIQALLLARELVQNDACPLDDGALMGGLQSLLGEHQLRSGHWNEAERSLREATAIWDELVDETPNEMPFRWGQATTHDRLARLFLTTGQWSEGEQFAQETSGFLERHLGRFPFDFVTRRHLVSFREAAARIHQDAARLQQAMELRRKALVFREQEVTDQPNFTSPRAALATKQCELAELLVKDGQFVEAQNLLSAALAHYRHLLSLYPQDENWIQKAREAQTQLERLPVPARQ